jgi:hypothetical protein
MKPFLQKLVETASDAKVLAASIGQAGIQYVQGLLGGIPFISSISALSLQNVDRDETHYLLIPFPDGTHPYTVFIKRVIPEGMGITNSLPRARIFHVPDESGRKLIERELISKALTDRDVPADSRFADRLDLLANEIDRETAKISGGLLLIGGAVAFINPILGAGIAAKGLLPSVGAKASKAGIGYVSEKLRKWNQSATEARITKEAQQEVKRLKPELFHNPLLQSVDALLTNPNAAYDPFFAGRNWIAEFPSHRYFKVTVDGIAQTYNGVSEWEKCPSLSNTARQWIIHLIELNEC